MADYRRIFQHAVLAALSLPAFACGGTTTTAPYDAGRPPFDPAPPDAGGDGGATCGWAAAPPSAGTTDCFWYFTFTGDPVACAGFGANVQGSPAQCLALCGANGEGHAPDFCSISSGASGNTLDCSVDTTTACRPVGNGGRRPEYFASLGFGPAPAGRELGTHFARVACMEAGSVDAFRMLRDELREHGAPRRLVRGASRSMRDEMRHVRQTSALARRFGAEPVAKVKVPPRARRSLEALARENAVEGCVRETYSALECLWQAQVARDPVVRATMTRIARDEMRHLALSWEVHAWAMSRLDRAARARVQEAQRDEVGVLARELVKDPAPALGRAAGLPAATQSRALVDAIAAQVGRAA